MKSSHSNAPAQIMIPLDIPDVDVKETQLCDGKLFISIIPKNRGRTRRHKVHEEKILCSLWLCERITAEIWEDTFITVESQKETVGCGICHQQIPCKYGKGQRIELRHLSVLGQETYVVIYPKRGQCPTCATHPTGFPKSHNLFSTIFHTNCLLYCASIVRG